MQEISEIISETASGVVRLAFFKDREQVGNGSVFLSNHLVITNSHVTRPIGSFDAIKITFGDQDLHPVNPIRYLPSDFYATIISESPEAELDYAILKIDEPELKGRFQFDVVPGKDVKVGEQVLFFGFPFGSQHLTSHIGYISAKFHLEGSYRLQIDGSINPGNSGGPLIQLKSGKAIAIVTQTQTGLEKDFDQLVELIKKNVEVLGKAKGGVTISGIDPHQATQATMIALGRIAQNLKRTANVGIGYAFCAEHILATGLLG